MSFTVEMERKKGRGGWVHYSEHDWSLRFEWDDSSLGFDIYIPTPNAWDAFCDKQNAPWAKARRDEIITRIAESVGQTRGRHAKWQIYEDRAISYSFEGNWLFELAGRILGLK